MRGRVEVARELTIAKPESLSFLDNNGNTVLHLYVKYNHLETLKALVELELHITDGDRLNFTGSGGGNTILHLAVMLKQVETTRYLLSISKIREAASMKNEMGYTVHDISERSPKDLKNLEIQLMLMKAGNGIKTEEKGIGDSTTSTPTAISTASKTTEG